MTIEEEYRLSFYSVIARLSDEHPVFLVQRTDTKKIFVKKELSVYNYGIYKYLIDYPVPDTPRIYEAVRDGDTLTVIEEYIPGSTLAEILTERGAFSERETVSVTEALCVIVEALHSAHPPIVHRDIKPSNIILTPDGREKLLDMNAAKWETRGERQDTELIGTVGYAAPEQYGFASSTGQTDIYAIGVLLNSMLTGELPGVRQAGGRLGKIVGKCTRLEPGARYKNVHELLSALRGGDRKERSPKRFLLPGFRSGKAGRSILAAIGYLFILGVSVSLEFKDMVPGDLWLNRAVVAAMLFTQVLYYGNYLGVRDSVTGKVKNPAARLILNIAMGAAILFGWVTVLLIIERTVGW